MTSLILIGGCQSSTVLRSTDPQAEVFLSETDRETRELYYKDRKLFYEETEVQVRKSGCVTKYYKISKSDEFAPEGLFLGLVTYGVGLLWITKYHPFYELNFKCEFEAKAK